MEKKPNIIYIMNDHQAYYKHSDSSYGPKTPNFDKLAAEGAKFDNAYCVTPLCGPARRSMLTGLYAHTHKQHFNDSCMPYTEESYLRLLAQNGYKNYYYGKWHAGPGTPNNDHNCEGFSCEGYGNPYITEEYKNYLEEMNLAKAQHLIEKDFTPKHHRDDKFFVKMKEGELYSCEDSWCGEHAIGKTVTPKETHEAFFLAHLAIKQLEELAKNKDNGQPFHLRLDFWGPHEPFFPTQEFIDMYNPSKIPVYGNFNDDLKNKAEVQRVDANNYISKDSKLIVPSPLPWSEWQTILSRVYAHISMIDAAGGLVLDKIKELNLDDNTIIMWTADHGDAIASHGGHFDKVSYMTQEMMRIPMAMKWKGVVDPNTVINELTSNLDMPETMLDAANIKFNQKVHGRSLLDLFKPEVAPWREGLMCETNGHGYIERLPGRLYVKGDWKYVWFEGDKEELYNLKKDPFELINLVDFKEFNDKKETLKKLLIEEQRKSDDPVVIN